MLPCRRIHSPAVSLALSLLRQCSRSLVVPSTRFKRRDDFEWYLNASQLAASTKCGAVVIAPSCWDEIPPSSQFDQFTLDLRRIFRVPRLKTSQPGWHQLSEHRFEVIDAERVRQNRYTTGC